MSTDIDVIDVQESGTAITADRAGFGQLRAQLHERSADLDLVELWAELRRAERRAVLQSAQLNDDTTQQISHFTKAERDAIRNAIHRMSGYASRLKGRLAGESAAAGMAANAAAALTAGDEAEVLHWLNMIQKEAA